MQTLFSKTQLGLAVSTFAAVLFVGCAAETGDEAGENSMAAQEINGVLNANGCTAARQAKLQTALTYAFNRVKDGQYALAECMNRSYIYNTLGKTGVTGWSIAGMLAANNVTSITCANLAAGTNARAGLSITGEALIANNSFIDGNGTVFIAGVIAHEILHNRGFAHGDIGSDLYYSNCASEQVEACFNKWVGNTSVDKGYVLFWDGKRLGNEPAWTRANAVSNCSWNKANYPAKRIECFYNNARLGYELFIGGSNIESRVGYEPAWTIAQATANCESNVKSRPGTQVECLFDGKRIGYELYFDGARVGKEPTWTLDLAKANCSANQANYPNKKVECFYNGDGIGYELLWDGKRVGFEPAWTQSQASTNCSWNKSTYPSRVIECLYNGKKI